jgi:hypothetical protein
MRCVLHSKCKQAAGLQGAAEHQHRVPVLLVACCPTTTPMCATCLAARRFIRGKKRSGFDFQLELQWQHSSAGSKGTLKVPSATPDDLDDLHCEVSIDPGTGDTPADDAARQAAKKLKEPLQELLGQLLAELRSK